MRTRKKFINDLISNYLIDTIVLVFLSALIISKSYIYLQIVRILTNIIINNQTIDVITELINNSYLLLMFLVISGIELVRKIYSNNYENKIEYDLYRKSRSKMMNLKWQYLNDSVHLNKINNVSEQGINAFKLLSESILKYVNLIGIFGIYIYLTMQISVLFSLITLLVSVIMVVVTEKIATKGYGVRKALIRENNEKSYFLGTLREKNSRRESHYLGLENFLFRKWGAAEEKRKKLEIKSFKNFYLIFVTRDTLLSLTFFSVLVLAAFDIGRGNAEVSIFVMMTELLIMFLYELSHGVYMISNNKELLITLENYYTMLEFDEDNFLEEDTEIISIDCNALRYRYPQSNDDILKGINLKFEKGERIAIVGENGSGKTTLTNILLGLVDPTEGFVTINQNIDFNPSLLNSRIKAIVQEFGKYHVSLMDNILIGKKEVTDDKLNQVIKLLELDKIANKLPNGYDTILGNLSNGYDISEGQWQRIAVARLLLNDNSDIWILDEPTAHLDPLAEIEIYDLINEHADDKAVLFISHRLGYARKADRIIVVDDGEIIEEGNHDYLMKINGKYAKMYDIQKSWFVSNEIK